MKNQKRFKKIVEGSLISLMIALSVFIIDHIQKIDFIVLLKGAKKSELEKVKTPAPVLDSGNVTDGIILTHEYKTNDKTVQEQKKIITKEIRIEQDVLLEVIAYSHCQLSASQHVPGEAVVISKIFLDGIELTKDCCSSTVFTDWIASTAVLQKNVEAGKHHIRVEGIYCGYDSNTHIDSKLNFSMHRTKRAPIEVAFNQPVEKKRDIYKLSSISKKVAGASCRCR